MISFFKRLFLLALSIVTMIACKEKNEIYPPVPWSVYYHKAVGIEPTPISSILVESDHAEWFGSAGNVGLIHGNGTEFILFDENNTDLLLDSVTCILRDGNDLLWVSAKNGLSRYDGSNWVSIQALKDRNITSIAVRGIGEIWIGIDGDSQNGGVALLKNGEWTFFSTSQSNIQSSHITCLLMDHQQGLWAGTKDHGVLFYNGTEWITQPTEQPLLEPSQINSLCLDAEGTVWAGTEASQVIRFSEDISIVLSTGTSKPVNKLLSDQEGKLWIATRGAGILTLENSSWKSFTKYNMHLPSDTILTLALHPNNNMLASFPDGHILYFKN
jgi:ligand-binding sensor domain-containing protein